jgi:hypothetical protein
VWKKGICFLALLLVLSSVLWSQQPDILSGAISQAEALTTLLENIEQANSEQQSRLRDLSVLLENSENELMTSRQAIADLKSISETQGGYVERLLEEARRQQAIYEAQLSYQKRLQLRLKILIVSLAAAVPAAIAGTAWLTYKLVK